MPFVMNNGVRIHHQVEGDGLPLVVQHGFTSSLEAWRQFGYVEALRARHRLILLDARGHGASDKPHDPAAYDLPLRVGDILAVLDALEIRAAHFFGFSMGGWIGIGTAKYAPQRLRSLIAVGTHPYVDNTWAAFKGLDGRDAEVFINAHEAVIGERIPPQVRPLVLANDLEALAVAAQERPSLEDVLPGLSLPCLFVVGGADSRQAAVQSCVRHVPGAKLVCLPGLKHIGSFIRSDLVLPHVTEFLESVSWLPSFRQRAGLEYR